MTKQKTLNEMAGASAAGLLLVLLIVGLVAGVLGLALQKAQPMFTGLSGDGSNTIWTLEVLFGVSAFIVFLAAAINHLISEKSDANQGV